MPSTILLIEDNEQNRYLTTYLLEKSGHKVVSALTGPEGLQIAEQILPDLIVLDIQLPEMDGYEVATALKSRPLVQEIPIVAVTSYAMAGDRDRILGAGAAGYIEKPINPDTFVSEIESHFRH